MLGSAVPAPVGSHVSRWRQDPWALGSYSFLPVGSSSKDRKALYAADWEGRLFLAGEANSADHDATVHGALITGRKAAESILERVGR